MEHKDTLRLTVDIRFSLNGVDPDVLKKKLTDYVQTLCDEEQFSVGTQADIIESWPLVEFTPEPLDPEEIEEHLTECINQGSLKLEDIPAKMAEYGLMETPDFVAEMRKQLAD